jgi:hypothetical protein
LVAGKSPLDEPGAIVALSRQPLAAAPCLKLLLDPFNGVASVDVISMLPCFFCTRKDARSQSTNTAPAMLESVC